MERCYIRSSFLPASYGISRFNRLAFKCSGAITTCATPRILIAFLCLCFAPPAFAKLGETVPQLVERFGKRCTGAQPANAAWTMTVGLAQAFATLSTPAPTPPKQPDQQHPTPVATQPTATEPASKQNQAQRVEFESIKAKAESGDADFQYQL